LVQIDEIYTGISCLGWSCGFCKFLQTYGWGTCSRRHTFLWFLLPIEEFILREKKIKIKMWKEKERERVFLFIVIGNKSYPKFYKITTPDRLTRSFRLNKKSWRREQENEMESRKLLTILTEVCLGRRAWFPNSSRK